MDNLRWWCDKCNDNIVPVDGVTAIRSRGYWWCAKHCSLTDGGVVDFPSNGKLVPDTILNVEAQGRP